MAHYLLTSNVAAELDINIYNSQDRLGLTGHTSRVCAQLFNVPMHIGCRGYYDHYWRLLEELAVPTMVMRPDLRFYGAGGSGGLMC